VPPLVALQHPTAHAQRHYALLFAEHVRAASKTKLCPVCVFCTAHAHRGNGSGKQTLSTAARPNTHSTLLVLSVISPFWLVWQQHMLCFCEILLDPITSCACYMQATC
jgi:hypothetical protein